MTVDIRALRAEFRALDEKAARDLVETIIDVYKAERSHKNTLIAKELAKAIVLMAEFDDRGESYYITSDFDGVVRAAKEYLKVVA